VRAVEGAQFEERSSKSKREEFEFKKTVIQSKKGAPQTVETGPIDQKMAA
jgi:hypothetical protein